MVHSIEHEKQQIAEAVAILGYDLDRVNPTVPTLLKENTLDMLVAQREDLLAKIDEQIALDAFYEVPVWMDATWLATQLQTEFGSEVEAGEHLGTKAIVIVPHYKI